MRNPLEMFGSRDDKAKARASESLYARGDTEFTPAPDEHTGLHVEESTELIARLEIQANEIMDAAAATTDSAEQKRLRDEGNKLVLQIEAERNRIKSSRPSIQ
jgi:hypothetical protein